MRTSFDVIVIGGGIVGLCAAIAMSHRNHAVALIDAGAMIADTDAIDSRVYAINHASQALLQGLGAWERLAVDRISPYQQMHVWDAVNGAHIDFEARNVAMGHLGHIIEESIIKQALLQCVHQENITLIPHCKITELQLRPDEISISDGKTIWLGKLLMVADGANSAMRELLKVPLIHWPYHQQAIVTSLQTEKSHQRTAYQVFNRDGPLAFLPLVDSHQCSIVWSTTALNAKSLMILSDEAFGEAITSAFSAKLGKCQVIGRRHQFPLHMRHVKQYSGARWLLMGDAAHTIHPLAGLGLNLGLADLAAWLGMIDTKKQSLGSRATLGAYQRMRKFEVWQMIALMEGLKAIFANPFLPVVALRGIGIQACNHLLPLKRLFVEQAGGC